MKNLSYFNPPRISLILKIIALALIIWLMIAMSTAFGQTKPQSKTKKKTEKQMEFVLNYELSFDSVTVIIPWIRLQDSMEHISSLAWILDRYLQKSNDTLWLEIPTGYVPFKQNYPGNERNDVMVEIRNSYYYGLKKEDEVIIYIPKSEIIGNRLPISYNTKQKKQYIYLYL